MQTACTLCVQDSSVAEIRVQWRIVLNMSVYFRVAQMAASC
jgi:hypothetical protein